VNVQDKHVLTAHNHSVPDTDRTRNRPTMQSAMQTDECFAIVIPEEGIMGFVIKGH